MEHNGLWQLVGYCALFAALIDFVAMVIWFQRGESAKAFKLLATGILMLLVFLFLVVASPDSGQARPVAMQKALSTRALDLSRHSQ